MRKREERKLPKHRQQQAAVGPTISLIQQFASLSHSILSHSLTHSLTYYHTHTLSLTHFHTLFVLLFHSPIFHCSFLNSLFKALNLFYIFHFFLSFSFSYLYLLLCSITNGEKNRNNCYCRVQRKEK